MSDVEYQFINNDAVKVSTTGLNIFYHSSVPKGERYSTYVIKRADDACIKDFGNGYRAIGVPMQDGYRADGEVPVYCVHKTIIDNIKKMGSHYKPISKVSSTFLHRNIYSDEYVYDSPGPWWGKNGEWRSKDKNDRIPRIYSYRNNPDHLPLDLGKCESDFGTGWVNVSQFRTNLDYYFNRDVGKLYAARCRNFVKEYNDAVASIQEAKRQEDLKKLEDEYKRRNTELEADYKKLLKKLEADKAALELEKDKLELDKKNLQSSITQLEILIEELKTERDNLRKRRDELSKQVIEQQELKDTVQAQLDAIKDEMDIKEAKIIELEGLIADKENELIEIEQKHTREINRLNSEHKTAIDQLNDAIADVEAQMDKVLADWEEDRNQLIDYFDQKIIDYEATIKAREEELEKALANMKATLEEINGKIKEFRESEEERKQAIIDEMQGDIDNYLIKLEQDRTDYEAQFDQERAARTEAHNTEMAELETAHQQKLATIKAQNEKVYQDLNDARDKMEKATADMQTMVDYYEKKMEEYREQYRKELDELNDKHEAELIAAQARLDAAIEVIKRVTQEHQDNYNKTIQSLYDDIDAERDKLHAIRTEYSILKNERDALQLAIEGKEKELEDLKNQVEAKRAEAQQEYDRIIEEAKAEAERIKEEAENAPLSVIVDAHNEAKRIKDEARDEADRILAAAGVQVTRDKDGNVVRDDDGKLVTQPVKESPAWSTANIIGVAGAGVAGLAIGSAMAMMI